MLAREKKRPIKSFPKKNSPGPAARKRPVESEVAEVKLGKKRFTLEGSAIIRLKDFLTKELGEESVPWREVFKKELANGEPAAMLRGARLRAGMTQDALAKELKTEQPNVAAMESGNRAISKEMARRLGELFKLDYRVFL